MKQADHYFVLSLKPEHMIITENNTPYNNEEEEDDQLSQQDVQSDGIDAIPPSEADTLATEIDNLKQADKSSEASYTLDVDRGFAPKKEEE
ncbi:hypothetical protein HDE69_003739 [Pedobacter cryoconitis]|uniref:Uncharacterized protein n=1 Tax=Pedobacter cryoconitis TaxID=188932 RepID=A0A7W8YVQ7_9SPHI|nr:hypothetical protein [Pedobacter cryoconitis]MBB5622661.1 hypothetical protein [Pedobacter cryoconitis]